MWPQKFTDLNHGRLKKTDNALPSSSHYIKANPKYPGLASLLEISHLLYSLWSKPTGDLQWISLRFLSLHVTNRRQKKERKMARALDPNHVCKEDFFFFSVGSESCFQTAWSDEWQLGGKRYKLWVSEGAAIATCEEEDVADDSRDTALSCARAWSIQIYGASRHMCKVMYITL